MSSKWDDDPEFTAWAAQERAEKEKAWARYTSEFELLYLPAERESFESLLFYRWDNEKERRADRARQRLSAFRKAVPQRAGEIAAATTTYVPAVASMANWHAATKDKGGIAVLSGVTGAGKTVAAAWYVYQIVVTEQRWAFPFIRAAELATLSRYGGERDKYLDAERLVIDDLGSEYLDAKGSFLVDLDELVDRFYAGKRHLVITTNCTKATFKKRYGERITDRLRECGTWIAVTGESRRKTS